MKAIVSNGLSFDDSDVINRGDFIPKGDYNPHRVRPWLLHDHGFTLAVVFASNLSEALDIAADNGRLDRFKIDPTNDRERADYLTDDFGESIGDKGCPEYVLDGVRYWWRVTPSYLGNAGEPFDIETVDFIELQNPPFSFAALWAAYRGQQ